ncbi:MAG: hypothetical protein E6I65_00995 [Chloroflexi bacterium]|nr:MAG: hypothetical protein E6I65_00995 [Chloroflexota bacterium]
MSNAEQADDPRQRVDGQQHGAARQELGTVTSSEGRDASEQCREQDLDRARESARERSAIVG